MSNRQDIWELLLKHALIILCVVSNTIYFSGQILLKRKGQEWDFDFPNLPLFFYADICMMAKESTPSKTGHSLVAMLNSKWIGVKVVLNQRLHHL